MILDQLPLTRLLFDLYTIEAAEVPAYKGDVLRMALLWWLSEFWCPMPDRCRHGCRQPDGCTFGRLCEPRVDPAWPSGIRHLMGNTPPPAYTLWDLHDRRRELAAGTDWGFELVLAGEQALRHIPAIVSAVQQGAEQGMGRIRLHGRVRQVVALPASGTAPENGHCLAVEKPQGDGLALTWQDFRPDEIALRYTDAARWADACDGPVHALSLRYQSPVKIKEQGQWVETPLFRPVARALVRRLRLLSVVHGAGEWPHGEWGPLLDLAETVRLEHDETFWTGYTRRSRRSGTQEVEGFIGQAWYASEADLRPLLPILWLGQWLHIGKGYVLGNGRYRVDRVDR